MSEYNVRFRDPVHGFVHLSPKELKLVDSPEFQRLRRIKQLALTYLVYPGAMHTRFEHSLGVVELSTRAFETLLRRDGSISPRALNKQDYHQRKLRKSSGFRRYYTMLVIYPFHTPERICCQRVRNTRMSRSRLS